MKKEIANRIKAARKAKGYTFKQLAEITGISKSHLSNIESCHRKTMAPEKFMILANTLGVTTDYLLNGECYE